MSDVPITIVGGGVISGALAYTLSQKQKGIVVLEKNKTLTGDNQSARNSGVIHAGIYYKMDAQPLKATLCVEGNRMMYRFCEKFDVDHQNCGKLVVATDKREEEYLEDVVERAEENGVPYQRMTREEAQKLEPNVECTSALYFPTSGIIEPTELVQKLHALAKQRGVDYALGNEMIGVETGNDGLTVRIKSDDGESNFTTDVLINSAGLYSDEIAKMVNPESSYEILPSRGEAAKYYKTRRAELEVGMNIYPAPYGYDPATGEKAEISVRECKKLLEEKKLIYTVGIHLTPLLDEKTITIGPAKNKVFGKEEYGSGLRELDYYYDSVKGFFPALTMDDLELHQAGIMAVPKGHRDWIIERDVKNSNCINLIGLDSPALTGSLAIAKHVVKKFF